MEKSYPDQLGEWIKRQNKSLRDRNLVAFLAVVDDVRAAVEAGYSIKAIWTNMRESKRIDFGYDSFLKYANRLVAKPNQTAKTPSTEPDMGNDKPVQQKPVTKTRAHSLASSPVAGAGFTFNATPRKEDLL
jgi:hypothetical protein